jgi:hypothetical protein
MEYSQLEEVIDGLQELDATADGREALAAEQMSVTGS